MSFVVTVYVPEGIVMASDSRQFITVEAKSEKGKTTSKVETVSSDWAYKTFFLERAQVGINAFGQAHLGKISVESHVRRFDEEVIDDSDDVVSVADKIVDFFSDRFPGVDTAFHVAGFRTEGRISIPYVYYCHVGREEARRNNVKPGTDQVVYGATWGGQIDVISRLVKPHRILGPDNKPQAVKRAPIIWDAMNLQDAVDFAIYAIRTTIDTMRFEARLKNVGGSIDVLLVTPSGARWVQRKKLRGETPSV